MKEKKLSVQECRCEEYVPKQPNMVKHVHMFLTISLLDPAYSRPSESS